MARSQRTTGLLAVRLWWYDGDMQRLVEFFRARGLIFQSAALGLVMFAYAAILIPHDRWRWTDASKARAAKGQIEWLIQVAEVGDIGAMRRVLDSGVDPNAQNDLGIDALISAAANRKYDAVAFLMSKGADPSLRTKTGLSALDFAHDHNDRRMEELLTRKE